MDDKNMVAFIEWLPTKIKELEGKSPEEIVGMVNQLAESEEGVGMLTQLIEQFKTESSRTMFKKGGLLGFMPDGGPGQVVAARDLPNKKKPKKRGFVDVGKMQDGGTVPETRNNAKVDANATYKSGMQPWVGPFGPWGSTKKTELPLRSGTTAPRSIQRVFGPSGKTQDRITTPGGLATIREVTPSLDTIFINNKGAKFGKGTPQYNEYQGFWKEYGVYQDGGILNNIK